MRFLRNCAVWIVAFALLSIIGLDIWQSVAAVIVIGAASEIDQF